LTTEGLDGLEQTHGDANPAIVKISVQIAHHRGKTLA
jgi:hypothetical protein